MIAAITGQMRSGTAAMAEVVHTLGVPVGIIGTLPGPPTWRLEWEDLELTIKLMDFEPLPAGWMEEYLSQRFAHARKTWDVGDIAIKSPFLARYPGDVSEAAKALGHEVRWIVMSRDQRAIDASLSNFHWMGDETNQRIAQWLRLMPKGHLEVRYENLCAFPSVVLDEVLAYTGISPRRRAQALASVKEPLTAV